MNSNKLDTELNKLQNVELEIILALFFLLIWTVYSPWGSPFGSAPNLNLQAGVQ